MVTVMALCVAAGSVLLDIYMVGVMRKMERQHSRERESLVNKIMHLAGKTWEPPPASRPEPSLNEEPEESLYVTDPSMLHEEIEEE